MKQTLLLAFLSYLNIAVFCQTGNLELEINPFIRFDTYPEFTYAPNASTTSTANISGISPGINFNLRSGARKIKLKYGVGYYRYSFNNIRTENSMFGEADNRRIEGYVPPGSIIPLLTYATDKYHYNNLSFLFAIEKDLSFSKVFRFSYGLQVTNYLKFSQAYNIDVQTNPTFRVSDFQYFGFSAGVSASMVRQFRKVNVGLSFYCPVVDTWRKDSHFPREKNSDMASKWLRGVSVGVIVSRGIK